MPQLGESVTEGTIVRWLKAEGDEVQKDEPICEVDTDKVGAELPSPLAGTVQKILISEGATVDVGTELMLMAVAGEDLVEAEKPPSKENASAKAPMEELPASDTEAQPVAMEDESSSAGARYSGNGVGELKSAESLRLTRSSPVVRRLAAEHGIDLQEVSGTGIESRVTKKDVEQYIEGREAAPETPPEPETIPKPEPAGRERVAVHKDDRVVDLTGIRRTIAGRMSQSKREAPHAWAMVEVDVSGLVRLREKMKEEFMGREVVRLTYLPFIVGAVIEGLKEYPVLNSVWDEDRIVLRKRINIGVAVDLDDALIVPVIPVADELNILGLARKIDDLVSRTRSGELSPDDTAGGTFTVNNPGSLGSVVSTPIINHPQAAILSAESIVKRPVVVEDSGGEAIAIRSMMNLEVSFDHRILDGGTALRFLNSVKGRLEGYTPESELE